jgi:hypothetical protein
MPKTNNNKLGETYYPLAEQEAREWYQRKYINTTAYVLVIKRLFTKPEASFVIHNVLEFCKEWGIAKSSFYRAVNTLSTDGKLHWEATQGIVLKPQGGKVVSIPRDTDSHEWDTDSQERDKAHERNTDSQERDKAHERNTDSQERNKGIYIEHAHDRSKTDLDPDQSDLKQISPLTPQGELREREATAVKVEVLEEEPATLPSLEANTTQTSRQEQNCLVQIESSAAPRKKPKFLVEPQVLEKLVADFDSGDLSHSLPREHLAALADAVMGEYISLYRVSGSIKSQSWKDYQEGFISYCAANRLTGDLKGKLDMALSMIQGKEQDYTKWGGLIDIVKGWQEKTNAPRLLRPTQCCKRC